MEWLPIETAPKNGKFFLMSRHGREPIVVNQPKNCARGVWRKFGKKWYGGFAGGEGTHWMPLPEPPK